MTERDASVRWEFVFEEAFWSSQHFLVPFSVAWLTQDRLFTLVCHRSVPHRPRPPDISDILRSGSGSGSRWRRCRS
jgi:hypothetical protein